jgi:hypothetical protein
VKYTELRFPFMASTVTYPEGLEFIAKTISPSLSKKLLG